MKILLLALSVLALSSSAFARGPKPLCEAGAKEITHCKSNAWVAVYPFATVCQDQTGYNLMIDDGGQISKTPVATSTTDTAVVFKSGTPDLTFTILKTGARDNGTNATLTFPWAGEHNSEYRCSPLAQ